jgi:hypothetical protein
MSVECSCEEWKKYIPMIDGSISLSSIHGMWVPEFKSFVYCPYCGKKLTLKKD